MTPSPSDRLSGNRRPEDIDPPEAPRPPRRPALRHPGRIALAIGGVILALGVLVLAINLYTMPLSPSFQEPERSGFLIADAEGTVVATRGVTAGRPVALAEMPASLVNAVIAFEDRRFRDHWGVDPRGIARAIWVNLRSGGRTQGASTLTQQLVKNTLLTPEKTFTRKIQEAMLALWIERKLTKDEILERYLNSLYLGAGSYGVDAAARRYFNKPVTDLSLAESAMIAGLIQAPARTGPTTALDVARQRAELVLDVMRDQGLIGADEATWAKAHPASLAVPPIELPAYGAVSDWIADEARKALGPLSGDFLVVSTLDRRLQVLAQQTIQEGMAAEGEGLRATQAALVAMAPDGRVLAMVGGRDYQESQFNRAVQARRQPGSIFKLFVYLTALSNNWRPDDPIDDTPLTIDGWSPENYGGGAGHGSVPLRVAFAHSYNLAAVRLQESVGREAVIATARSMGLKGDLQPLPSLALGTFPATLLDLTSAFAAVAADRATVQPRVIEVLRTPGSGEIRPPLRQSGRAPWPRASALDLLNAVVTQGTGRAAALGVPTYGKTGTTQDNRDAWFIGFAGNLVIGVWVGNDDETPMTGISGGGLPAKLWQSFAARALAGAGAGGAAAVPSRQPFSAVPEAVVDTGALRLGGRVVRLEGVKGLTGRPARDMAGYIGDRSVTCRPAGRERWRCDVEGWDLSEVALFNGGARATADAPADLVAAERKARQAGRGVWGR